VSTPVVEVAPRRYGRSALVAGARTAASSWRVVLPVVVLAAAAQALLVVPDAVPGQSAAAAILTLVSFLVVAIELVLVAAVVLESVDGGARWPAVLALAARRGWVVALWLLAWLVVVSVGLALWIVPGVLVALLTPYLFLAAMDGRGNALGANLAAIRARVGRWIVTSVLSGVLVGGAWLGAVVGGFFVPGPASALVVWLWFGLLGSWLLATWAVVYRSTPAGLRP
jgi:hypothetical protein